MSICSLERISILSLLVALQFSLAVLAAQSDTPHVLVVTVTEYNEDACAVSSFQLDQPSSSLQTVSSFTAPVQSAPIQTATIEVSSRPALFVASNYLQPSSHQTPVYALSSSLLFPSRASTYDNGYQSLISGLVEALEGSNGSAPRAGELPLTPLSLLANSGVYTSQNAVSTSLISASEQLHRSALPGSATAPSSGARSVAGLAAQSSAFVGSSQYSAFNDSRSIESAGELPANELTFSELQSTSAQIPEPTGTLTEYGDFESDDEQPDENEDSNASEESDYSSNEGESYNRDGNTTSYVTIYDEYTPTYYVYVTPTSTLINENTEYYTVTQTSNTWTEDLTHWYTSTMYETVTVNGPPPSTATDYSTIAPSLSVGRSASTRTTTFLVGGLTMTKLIVENVASVLPTQVYVNNTLVGGAILTASVDMAVAATTALVNDSYPVDFSEFEAPAVEELSASAFAEQYGGGATGDITMPLATQGAWSSTVGYGKESTAIGASMSIVANDLNALPSSAVSTAESSVLHSSDWSVSSTGEGFGETDTFLVGVTPEPTMEPTVTSDELTTTIWITITVTITITEDGGATRISTYETVVADIGELTSLQGTNPVAYTTSESVSFSSTALPSAAITETVASTVGSFENLAPMLSSSSMNDLYSDTELDPIISSTSIDLWSNSISSQTSSVTGLSWESELSLTLLSATPTYDLSLQTPSGSPVPSEDLFTLASPTVFLASSLSTSAENRAPTESSPISSTIFESRPTSHGSTTELPENMLLPLLSSIPNMGFNKSAPTGASTWQFNSTLSNGPIIGMASTPTSAPISTFKSFI